MDKSFYDWNRDKPSVEIAEDAAKSGGWSVVCSSTQTGGRWDETEKKEKNTNVLELLAIEYAIKSFQKEASGKHVKILTDNTCARSYIKYKRRMVLI